MKLKHTNNYQRLKPYNIKTTYQVSHSDISTIIKYTTIINIHVIQRSIKYVFSVEISQRKWRRTFWNLLLPVLKRSERSDWSIAERRRGEGVASRERESKSGNEEGRVESGNEAKINTPPLRGCNTVPKIHLFPLRVQFCETTSGFRCRHSFDDAPPTKFPRRHSHDDVPPMATYL